jgi:hypothetical protein
MPQPDAVGSVAFGTLVLTRNSGQILHDGAIHCWRLGRRSCENDPGDGLEVELAEQPVIFADVGVGIRGQDGG